MPYSAWSAKPANPPPLHLNKLGPRVPLNGSANAAAPAQCWRSAGGVTEGSGLTCTFADTVLPGQPKCQGVILYSIVWMPAASGGSDKASAIVVVAAGLLEETMASFRKGSE